MNERIMLNGKTIEENASELAHEVTEHCAELNGLSVLLTNLYQEIENGNRCLNTEDAYNEMLDAIFFSANALDRISKDLSQYTALVGC